MIFIGTDIVKNERFAHWLGFSDARLLRVFHPQEVAQFRFFLRQDNARAIQFLASRFAVKEAFFKAYFSAMTTFKQPPQRAIPFLLLARRLRALSSQGPVELVLDIPLEFSFSYQLSLAHEECCAVATVLLYLA